MEQPVKRTLRVVLMADDFVIAESQDSRLWRSVLDAIHRSEDGVGESQLKTAPPPSTQTAVPHDTGRSVVENSPRDETSAVATFADRLGVSIEVLQGSCRPVMTSPYLHLDHHNWEAMKKQTPARGPQAVSPIVVAATLLVLWLKENGQQRAAIEDAQKVLATIGTRDKNPARAIKNCRWLQMDGKAVQLNPAEITSAYVMARKYCKKSWKQENPEAV